MLRDVTKYWIPLLVVAGLPAIAAVAWGQAGTATTATVTATGPASIEDLTELSGIIKMMLAAFRDHGWALGAGLLLSVVVALARFVKALDLIKIPDSADKWVAMGLAMVTSTGLGLQSGEPWYNIIVTALTVGVTAIGGWEVALRPLRDKLLKTKKLGS